MTILRHQLFMWVGYPFPSNPSKYSSTASETRCLKPGLWSYGLLRSALAGASHYENLPNATSSARHDMCAHSPNLDLFHRSGHRTVYPVSLRVCILTEEQLLQQHLDGGDRTKCGERNDGLRRAVDPNLSHLEVATSSPQKGGLYGYILRRLHVSQTHVPCSEANLSDTSPVLASLVLAGLQYSLGTRTVSMNSGSLDLPLLSGMFTARTIAPGSRLKMVECPRDKYRHHVRCDDILAGFSWSAPALLASDSRCEL